MIRYDLILVDLTSNFYVLCTNMKVYSYNYSFWVESSINIHEGSFHISCESSAEIPEQVRSRGRWFETHQKHCVVSLNKTLYPLLSTGSTQENFQHD